MVPKCPRVRADLGEPPPGPTTWPRIVEAAAADDVVLAHPLLFPSSNPNNGTGPRVMAPAPFIVTEPMRTERGCPLSSQDPSGPSDHQPTRTFTKVACQFLSPNALAQPLTCRADSSHHRYLGVCHPRFCRLQGRGFRGLHPAASRSSPFQRLTDLYPVPADHNRAFPDRRERVRQQPWLVAISACGYPLNSVAQVD